MVGQTLTKIGAGQIHPKIVDRLFKEVRAIRDEPMDGINAYMNDECYTDIHAEIIGPDATPYEKGLYKIILKIPEDFPKTAPKGYFLTKIFHPNISEKGDICVNSLKKDWDPMNWSIRHILKIVHCLLINPFPESALNEEAGKLFMENYDQYSRRAKMFNEIHALTKAPTRVKRNENLMDEVCLNLPKENIPNAKENQGQDSLTFKSQPSQVLGNVSSNQQASGNAMATEKLPGKADPKKAALNTKKQWSKMI